jgi:hypothetical protein
VTPHGTSYKRQGAGICVLEAERLFRHKDAKELGARKHFFNVHDLAYSLWQVCRWARRNARMCKHGAEHGMVYVVGGAHSTIVGAEHGSVSPQ